MHTRIFARTCTRKTESKNKTQVSIIDIQSVKRETMPLKMVLTKKGKKHIIHVIVDKNGFLGLVRVTIAHIHVSKVVYLQMRVLINIYSGVKVILANVKYRGNLIDDIKKQNGYGIQAVISPYKEQEFRSIQRRWNVSRSFLWLDNIRRLFRNYKLTFKSIKEMV